MFESFDITGLISGTKSKNTVFICIEQNEVKFEVVVSVDVEVCVVDIALVVNAVAVEIWVVILKVLWFWVEIEIEIYGGFVIDFCLTPE